MKENGGHSSVVRKPVFAGSFYSSGRKQLTQQLEKLFAKAEAPASKALPQAIIAPHAGYVYSGQVAASAYNQLGEKATYKRVFVLASSHHCSFRGASVNNADFYETPLGRIKVDTQVVNKLHATSNLLKYRLEAHRHEHGLEVQLPFLQHKLGDNFMLVPVVFGTHDFIECKEIANILEPWFSPENLFVVSTDFSHYPAYDDAVENDFNTAQAICGNNPEELLKVLDKRKNISNLATSLCGQTSVLTLLFLTQGKKMKFLQVQYSNSGDAHVYGDKSKVVGYWAIAVYNESEKPAVPGNQQVELLENARRAILGFLMTGRKDRPLPSSFAGRKTAGMFVSLYVKGKLRGCIGNLNGNCSLSGTLEQLAVSASCDERFDRLKEEEFEDLELEISLLSPLREIKSIDEIELGKHGVYIRKGHRSGTFLPKVALKTGWTVEELLGHCSRDKAGLGWDEWKNASIYVYEAFVFRG